MNTETLNTYVCGYCAAEQSAEDGPCTCPHCGHFGPMRDFPTRQVLTTARQNDAFRAGMVVGGCPFPGTVVVTSGVSERGRDFVTNAIMAAARTPGITTLRNASGNYMVQDLCFYLQQLGVTIEGIGTTTLTGTLDAAQRNLTNVSAPPSPP